MIRLDWKGGLNTHGYVGRNPMTLFDMYGLRPLTQHETDFLKAQFGNCLNSILNKLDINERTFGDTSRAISMNGGFMSFPKSYVIGGDPNNSLNVSSPGIASIAGHEMLHQQKRMNGVNVTSRAMGLQIQYSLGISDPYDYPSSADPQVMLDTFKSGNAEQQGQMFQDYIFALMRGGNVAAFSSVAGFVKNNCGCGR